MVCLFCIFSRWIQRQKLEFFTKTVCWSFCTCPSRPVHCLCLPCGRFPGVLVSSWLWLMAIADEKSAGRRIERGQGNSPSTPWPPSCQTAVFHSSVPLYKGVLCCKPPSPSGLEKKCSPLLLAPGTSNSLFGYLPTDCSSVNSPFY